MTDIDYLTRWADSFEYFVTEALGADPSNQQLAVIRDIDAGEKDIAIKSGHGTGKTTIMAWVILWVGLFKYDAKIPATAPTAPQLIRLLIPEVKKWANSLPWQLKGEVECNNELIKFSTGNECVPRTARKESPEGLQGFHADFLTWIIDEASGVPNIIFEVVDGSLTGDDYLRIMAANPARTEGAFFDAFHRNAKLWKLHTFDAEQSSNVSKASIERKKIQYGEDSDAYRVRVKGQFPRSNSDAVIPLYVIEDAIQREEFNTFGAEVWGVDYADAGDDTTKLVKRTGNHFYEVIECPAQGAHRQVETANWIALEYNRAKEKPKAVFVDAIGEGSGLVSALNQPHFKSIPVIPVKVSESADDPTVYGNKRAELYYRLKEALVDEGKMFDNDMALGELSAQRFFITEKGKLMLVPKKDIKEALGRSPDIADAMALTCADIIRESETNAADWASGNGTGWMGR
jgi:hypothetical protein